MRPKLLEAVEKRSKRRKWAEYWYGISRWAPTDMIERPSSKKIL